MILEEYLDLTTQQHRDKPRFQASVGASIAANLKTMGVLKELLGDALHVDFAVGDQLNILGEWVGISRVINLDIPGLFFSLDSDEPGEGLDFGIWAGTDDLFPGATILSDIAYRKVIKAKISANKWDGTVETYYEALSDLLAPASIIVNDNQDMTFDLTVAMGALDTIDRALLLGGYLSLKPMGVRLRCLAWLDEAERIFGLDMDTPEIGGLDEGFWSQEICRADGPDNIFYFTLDSLKTAEGLDYGIWDQNPLPPVPPIPIRLLFELDSVDDEHGLDFGFWD
ncbi:MAG: DUF2612 domain-containing protein [Burkholderiales bacterium]